MTRTERNKEAYVGKTYTSMDGKDFIVKEYRIHDDVTIEFTESGFLRNTSMYYVLAGKVKSPFINGNHVVFEDPVKAILGAHYNIDGFDFEIIKVDNMHSITYRINGTDYIGTTSNVNNLRNGSITNPFKLNACGCYRITNNSSYTGKEYLYLIHKWHGICGRASGKSATYNYANPNEFRATRDARMCTHWKKYDNFAEWYLSSIANLNPNYQYDVDKDLMYPFYKYESQGLKVYSPVTCELLPHDLNVMIYDPRITRNEIVRQQIIELGEKYYQEHAISQRAYDAIDIIYKGNKDKQIYISLNESGYNEYIPRLDDFEDTY